MSNPDILDSLDVLSRCRRCSCGSCTRGGAGELHDHVCTDGEYCVETRGRLRKYRRFAAVTAMHAAAEIKALRRQIAVMGAAERLSETFVLSHDDQKLLHTALKNSVTVVP